MHMNRKVNSQETFTIYLPKKTNTHILTRNPKLDHVLIKILSGFRFSVAEVSILCCLILKWHSKFRPVTAPALVEGFVTISSLVLVSYMRGVSCTRGKAK